MTCGQVKKVRRLAAAYMAAVQIRCIAGEAGSPEFKHSFDLFLGQLQFAQRVQTVQDQGLKLRVWKILLGNQLRGLGKIGSQRQLCQIPTEPLKQFDGVCLVDRILAPVLKQGELPISQKLAGGDQGAVLPTQTPGFQRQLSVIPAQNRQQRVPVIVIRNSQDYALDGQIHTCPPI